MKKKAPIYLALALMILLALACDIPYVDELLGGITEGDGEGEGETSFTGGECESGTTRVQMNSSTTGEVTGTSYPDTCTVYCLWVPDAGSSLEIGISGFDVDLDMYVDTNLSVLQYEDHGQWESNAYGTDDESVTISGPGGRYYIQVCSYEGLPSSFTIDSTYR